MARVEKINHRRRPQVDFHRARADSRTAKLYQPAPLSPTPAEPGPAAKARVSSKRLPTFFQLRWHGLSPSMKHVRGSPGFRVGKARRSCWLWTASAWSTTVCGVILRI
jgi:hypothetical protein